MISPLLTAENSEVVTIKSRHMNMYHMPYLLELPSGELTQPLKMAIEIVSCPMNMMIFHTYVSLTEDKTHKIP